MPPKLLEGYELRRTVAEAAGWFVTQEGEVFQLWSPDQGKVYDTYIGFPETESAAWEYFIKTSSVFEFDTDLNLALALFTALDHDYTPRLVGVLSYDNGKITRSWKAHIMSNSHTDDMLDIDAIHLNPAIAVCTVYLQFQARETWRRSEAMKD